MGTYTAPDNLYKPSVGETGWGAAVDNNFDIIQNRLLAVGVVESSLFYIPAAKTATAVQAAIDAAAAAGGGTVYATAGTYTGASVTLAANVTLYTDGATSFPAVTIVDNSILTERINGKTYHTSRGDFGTQFNNTKQGANNVAIYRKARAAPALYIESTNENMANTVGQVDAGLRMERRNTGPSAGQDRGIDIESYYSGDTNVGPSLRIHANKAGENPSVLIENTHQASPNAGFTCITMIDNQQSGATGNAALDVRQYQDGIDALVLYDGQRSNGKSMQLTKGAGGGKVRVNKADGTERATLEAGTAGNRGALKMWDATLGAFRYAYIDNGAWVISSSEPT